VDEVNLEKDGDSSPISTARDGHRDDGGNTKKSRPKRPDRLSFSKIREGGRMLERRTKGGYLTVQIFPHHPKSGGTRDGLITRATGSKKGWGGVGKGGDFVGQGENLSTLEELSIRPPAVEGEE